MNCPDPETLSQYQAGALPVEEAEAVRQHLTGCARCATLTAVPPAPSHPAEDTASAVSPMVEDTPAALRTPLSGSTVSRPDCPSRDELRGYLDGSLPGERRAEVRDNIAECDDC